MIASQIIAAKRDGRELSDAEIAFFVDGYAKDQIPDYQMSALAMAIFLNGMTDRETATLTHQMLASGVRLQWPNDGRVRVDKHSTGGIGDKISIPLAPLLACCGLYVPMLSGRGLGATGGTLDKLEAIPGFRTDLSLAEIQTITNQVGCVITGASKELAPADRRLYALRDVTATVPSIPLITASIMSKKLAESLNSLVLDVKFGSGAFMKTEAQATALAHSLVATGNRMGVNTTAVLTDMNQPLGRMCGNAVEVNESIAVLQGGGPPDVVELTVEFAAQLLVSTGRVADLKAARVATTRILASGAAFEKYCQMVSAQGGQPEAKFPIAPSHAVVAEVDGVIMEIHTEALGIAIIEMGGGARVMTDSIDHSVGLEMNARIGDTVHRGDLLANVFCRDPQPHIVAVRDAVVIGDSASPRRLIHDRITA